MLSAAPESTPAAPDVSYVLHVTLSPEQHTLEGSGRVRWRNTSSRPAGEVRFSLYYNRRGAAPSAASIEVTSLRVVSSNRDLLGTATFAGPDQRPDEDRTLLRVPLGEPLLPGGEVSFDVRWVARVPDDAGIGGVVLLAHWFPQVAGAGDAGAYDVTIGVPRGWKVAATGHETASAGGAASEAHRFVQEQARDFAWAASRDWIEQRTRVERTGLPPVDVRVLARPEHARQLARMTAATALAVQRGRESLATYPYADLTVLDVPWTSVHANAAYPGLVTIATHWLEPARSTDLESAVAGVIAQHFWRQAVGFDPSAPQSMSDGLAVFTAARLGQIVVQHQLDSTSGDGFLVHRFFGGFLPYVNRSIRFDHAAALASADGTRAALALATLERYLGWPTLEMVLDEFGGRFRLAHPSPDDFLQVASVVSGRDLRWLFDGAWRDGLVYDYGVGQVTSETAPDGESQRTTIVVRRFGEGTFSGSSRPRTGGYESGRAIEVEVGFADGTIRREHWDGRDRSTSFVYESVAPVDRVAVDPDHVLRLDTKQVNNTWARTSRGPSAATRWAAHWLIWLQDLLLTCAALA